MNLNLINYITKEEIDAMPLCDLEVTKSTITSKTNNVRRESFQAILRFDRLTSFRMNITNDDYALLHYFSGKQYISDQFNVRAHVRIIETKWPAKDGRPEHSSYRLDIYVTEDVKWTFDITKAQFLPVLKMGIKNGSLAAFKPIERLPGKQEEEVEAPEDGNAVAPAANAEDVKAKKKKKEDEIPF